MKSSKHADYFGLAFMAISAPLFLLLSHESGTSIKEHIPQYMALLFAIMICLVGKKVHKKCRILPLLAYVVCRVVSFLPYIDMFGLDKLLFLILIFRLFSESISCIYMYKSTALRDGETAYREWETGVGWFKFAFVIYAIYCIYTLSLDGFQILSIMGTVIGIPAVFLFYAGVALFIMPLEREGDVKV